MDAARRDGLLLCWPWPRELTVWITACASGPSYGLMVAETPADDVRMGGGLAIVLRYARFATEASWKTIKRLVSSLHLILNPPLMLSHSAKADWMSFVFSSFGKPVKDKMRVTEAESPESDADAISNGSGND